MKMIPGIFGLIVSFAVMPSPVQAAEIQTPLTDEELTLRPGDTITWSPENPHRIRFGGSVVHGGNMVRLPSFDTVKKVLDIVLMPTMPPLEVTGEVAKSATAPQKVVATVIADAHMAGVTEFFFTCGFNEPHANNMVTVSFKFAAPISGQRRNVEIITAEVFPPNHRFLLKTPAGEKKLTRP
jgi:hypothetical protein